MPEAVTLREHASFVELPDGNFQAPHDDPRAGYGGITFLDYSAPVSEPMQMRFIRRHRLQKKDPSAAMSEAVKPIQYWVDSGAPEDVKKALIEGASWWNQAFEAAGFRNAFKVDVLPDGRRPDGHPLQHDQLGPSLDTRLELRRHVTDPRTGEIIKATVTLGSLRDRQDYMIFEGLLSPYVNGDEKPVILYETALARIRQLSAHEVGHTLGLGHNYYSSGKGWISVMDYPHPLEKLKADGTIDLSEAYAAAHRRVGQGRDQLRLSRVPQGHERGAGAEKDPRRRLGAGPALLHQPGHRHPSRGRISGRTATNQADELNRMMKMRRAALDRIGDRTIRTGAPMTTIEEPLVPIFMHHRYAVESAASMIGGQDFVYAMRGDGRTPDQVGGRGQSAPGARGAGRDVEAVGADDPEEDARADSAAAPGLRAASRAVPAHDGRGVRSAGPGHGRRGRHHRVRVAARSRGAHGGAERRRLRRCRVSAKSSIG